MIMCVKHCSILSLLEIWAKYVSVFHFIIKVVLVYDDIPGEDHSVHQVPG